MADSSAEAQLSLILLVEETSPDFKNWRDRGPAPDANSLSAALEAKMVRLNSLSLFRARMVFQLSLATQFYGGNMALLDRQIKVASILPMPVKKLQFAANFIAPRKKH
jgi:hypothetical protein